MESETPVKPSYPKRAQGVPLVDSSVLFLCSWLFFSACIYVYHMHAGGQKRVSDLLELELKVVVSHHVGAQN